MTEAEQALTLTPTRLRLMVDGTALDCTNWEQITKILANQARIHNSPVTVNVTDQQAAVTGTWTVDHNGDLLDQATPTDQPATITLHEWELRIPGHGATQFLELETATSRLEALAEATSSTITVHIEGAAPTGALTERFIPQEPTTQEQTSDTDEDTTPFTEERPQHHDDLDEELAQLLLEHQDQTVEPTQEQTPSPAEAEPEPKDLVQDVADAPADEQASPEQSGLTEEDEEEMQEESSPSWFDEALEELSETSEQTKDRGRKKVLLSVLACLTGLVLVILLGLWALSALFRPAPQADSPAAWGQSVAAEPAPGLSIDGEMIATATSTGVAFFQTSTGQQIAAHQTVMAQRQIYPFGQSGFYLTGGQDTDPMICTPTEQSITCQDVAPLGEDQNLIHRAGTIAAISTDEETVTVLSSDGQDTVFHRPATDVAYIAQHEDAALWASGKDGGTLAVANPNGSIETENKLATPSKGAEVSSWFGPTSTGQIAVLWSTDKDKDVMALHDPATGEITKQAEIPQVGKEDPKRLTETGNAALAGASLIDLETMTVHQIDKAALGEKTPQASSFRVEDGYLTPTGQTLDQGVFLTMLDEQDALLIIDGHLTVTNTEEITQ